MNTQEVTTVYSRRLEEILDWYSVVVEAAKEQKRKALEDLETWLVETYDGLKKEIEDEMPQL